MTSTYAYTYRLAEVKRVVDGDTVDLTVCHLTDIGFRLTATHTYMGRFRVVTVDTPERGQPGFTEATTFTRTWLTSGRSLSVTTYKDPDNFGRYLADIFDTATGESLAEALLRSGHAVPYSGR